MDLRKTKPQPGPSPAGEPFPVLSRMEIIRTVLATMLLFVDHDTILPF